VRTEAQHREPVRARAATGANGSIIETTRSCGSVGVDAECPRQGVGRRVLTDSARTAWGAWLRVESGVLVGRHRKGAATVVDVQNVTAVLGTVIEQMNDLVRHRCTI
jgi:hypothetical protein